MSRTQGCCPASNAVRVGTRCALTLQCKGTRVTIGNGRSFGRIRKWARAHFFYGCSKMAFEKQTVVEQVRSMADRIVASEGLELVEAEWKGGSRTGTLRVFIDKPAGITHADCERVSHQLSAALDVEDLIPGSYNLEVSSPGLDRKLQKRADFDRFAGRRAKLRIREPLTGARQVTGRIESSSAAGVCLRTASGETLEVAFDEIELARLVIEF